MGERRLGLIAAGVGFFALFALFPAVAALIALAGFWLDPVAVEDTLDLMGEFLPADAFELVADQARRLSGTTSRTLGFASGLSLLAATWSARLGVGALIQGLTAIYGGAPRGSLREIVLALFLTVTLMVVGLIAVAAILLVPVLLALIAPFIPADSWLPFLAEFIRWAVAATALVVGLGLFYRYGPNRPENLRSPFLSPGLVLAMTLWSLASVGFSIYLSNFGNYNEVYGSIGAVIALMMWLYLSAYAVLMGAALNYSIEEDRYAAP